MINKIFRRGDTFVSRMMHGMMHQPESQIACEIVMVIVSTVALLQLGE